MATTPNYGWVTPAPTDFVTDLPADFEIFADAVDADLVGLLGGTTGQVLTKTSNADHDFAFAAPPTAPVDNFTLINAGGTALTGAATITVSGISGKSKLWIYVETASSANASSTFTLRLNTDSGTNYRYTGLLIVPGGPSVFEKREAAATSYLVGTMGDNAANFNSSNIQIQGADSAGIKTIISSSASNGNTTDEAGALAGFYVGTSPITSVSLISSTGNFDAGTIFVYGA
jgi:hypothetical protein